MTVWYLPSAALPWDIVVDNSLWLEVGKFGLNILEFNKNNPIIFIRS
jgi:hypothetical protein